jgi:predicted phage replisome organizer
MADVKWIKITTDVFDDEKILLIESLPEADSIIVIWFKLLCLAGKQNNSGVFLMGDKIAYTDKMLATIFRRKETTVQLALQTFEQFGMIELIDGVITIPNWGKHQSLDQLEHKKQYMKNYMRDYREKQKLLTSKDNCKTNSKANVSQADKEEDKNKNRLEEDKNNILSDSDESAPAPKKKTKKKEPVKNAYGEFKNVLLTENEYENIANSFGVELRDKAIKHLDEYIEEKGYKSKSHNLAIRRWVIDAVKEKEAKKGRKEIVPDWMKKKSGFNDFAQKKMDAELDEMEQLFMQEVHATKTVNNDPDLAERAARLQEELKGVQS